MKKEIVMLVLCRKVIAGLLIEAIQKRICLDVFGVYEFNKAKNMALIHQPSFALVEIPEKHGDPALETLDVCDDIREVCPFCKIMLMCPEQDQKSVDACVEAKRQGKIEDYIFYDTTPEYLTSKLKSLIPA